VIGLIFVAVGVVVLDYPLENLNVIFVYFLQTLKSVPRPKVIFWELEIAPQRIW